MYKKCTPQYVYRYQVIVNSSIILYNITYLDIDFVLFVSSIST